jgi:hypothetical protein
MGCSVANNIGHTSANNDVNDDIGHDVNHGARDLICDNMKKQLMTKIELMSIIPYII